MSVWNILMDEKHRFPSIAVNPWVLAFFEKSFVMSRYLQKHSMIYANFSPEGNIVDTSGLEPETSAM